MTVLSLAKFGSWYGDSGSARNSSMPRGTWTAPATLPLLLHLGRVAHVDQGVSGDHSCACRVIRNTALAAALDLRTFAHARRYTGTRSGASATCKHNCVTTQVPPGLGNGFDNELGLEYLEVTPDGGRARLDIKDKLLQPWGIVHGGVYCSIVESLASVSGARLADRERRRHRRRGQQQHRLPARHLVGHGDRGVDADPPGPAPAAVARSPSPTTTTASLPAARCGCRTFRPSNSRYRVRC